MRKVLFVTKKAVPLQPLSGTKPSFVLGEREEIFERLDKKDVVQDKDFYESRDRVPSIRYNRSQ